MASLPTAATCSPPPSESHTKQTHTYIVCLYVPNLKTKIKPTSVHKQLLEDRFLYMSLKVERKFQIIIHWQSNSETIKYGSVHGLGMSHYESNDNFSFEAISDTVLRTWQHQNRKTNLKAPVSDTSRGSISSLFNFPVFQWPDCEDLACAWWTGQHLRGGWQCGRGGQ